MSGKTKQAQRTKNNSRPSSSLRSAQLLGSSVPLFVGFTAAENGIVPVAPGFQTSESLLDELEVNNIDPNFQMVLRKMTKKNETTKIKALNEFIELINNTEPNKLKEILPFWPKIYSNLAFDTEHRVRVTTQSALAALIRKLGKGIAVYLKQIAPCWVASQYDPYAPAATIAKSAFDSFPETFVKKLFGFSQNEILEYITKNLLQQASNDENDEKYQRIIICNLKAYSLYLIKIDKTQMNEAMDTNINLINNNKFWSFHKNKCSNIRAAWYEVIATILQHSKNLLDVHEKQLTTCVFNNLDELESMVIPHIWTSMLLIQQNFDNWHTHINFDKAFKPKLWKIIKVGGNGNASIIFPHLLPLISKLITNVMGDKTIQFYLDFFENIKTCLQSDTILQSHRDLTVVVATYYECLKYFMIQIPINNMIPAEELEEFGTELVNNHLISIIEWGIKLKSTNKKFIFNEVAKFIFYWSQTNNSVYQKIFQNIWEHIFIIVKSTLELKDDVDQIVEAQTSFILYLEQSIISKKKVGVAFDADRIVENSDQKVLVPLNYESLQNLVFNVCDIYLTSVAQFQKPVFIEYLEKLLKHFGNVKLYENLSKSKNLYDLCDTFLNWLDYKNLRLEILIDRILEISKLIPVEKKIIVINRLLAYDDDNIKNWIITRILSHPHCNEQYVPEILSQIAVKEHFVRTANNVIQDNRTSENLLLLRKCFYQNSNEDLLIDDETCENLINIMSIPLKDSNKIEVMDTCASFIAQTMPIIFSDVNKKELQVKMFLTLFEFSVNNMVTDDLSEDTLWEVTTSWQDVLSSNELDLKEIKTTCLDILDKRLLSDDEITVTNLEHLSNMIREFIHCATTELNDDSKFSAINDLMKHFFSGNQKLFNQNLRTVIDVCVFLECLNRKLCSMGMSNENNDKTVSYSGILRTLLMFSIFKMNIIFHIPKIEVIKRSSAEEITNSREEKYEYEVFNEKKTYEIAEVLPKDVEIKELLENWTEDIVDQICDVFAVVNLANIILEDYNTNTSLRDWKINEFKESITYLNKSVENLLKHAKQENIDKLKYKLFEKPEKYGPIWIYSLLQLLSFENCDSHNDMGVLLYEDILLNYQENNLIISKKIFEYLMKKIPTKLTSLFINFTDDKINLLNNIMFSTCLVEQYFDTKFDVIAENSINLYTIIINNSKKNINFLMYNMDISKESVENIVFVTEVINFVANTIRYYPNQLDMQQMDFIRIAISSWTLSVSQSKMHYSEPKVAVFIAAVYNVFSEFSKFLNEEKIKSSTKFLSTVLEEWNQIFAKDVNLVLILSYYDIIKLDPVSENDCQKIHYFLDSISKSINLIDLTYVIKARKIETTISLIDFCLSNISNKRHAIRIASVDIIKGLTPHLIAKDLETWYKYNEQTEKSNVYEETPKEWHLLNLFSKTIKEHNEVVKQYLVDFTFKLNDVKELDSVKEEIVLPYFLLWECIINICAKSSSEIRSIYTSWIKSNKFEHILLLFLIRTMPIDVLKNPDSKFILGQTMFASLEWENIAKLTISQERYACYIYTKVLRYLPALARKWWHDLTVGQSLLIEKITTNFVSKTLCQNELKCVLEKREKDDNMQITVHTSTSEVIATYSIDENKMELLIKLPNNHPLGTVVVECNRQIGGHLQSREVIKQLTIFLTHQNGSIWDGLSLWKKNLDRKFEGVEECYICYSVIHQDTCQLPKLSCKTCRKKFHGPCLYKWFNTSNKSTCPICRNIF